MISALVSFLSTSAGGALMRIVLQWLTDRSERAEQQRRYEHERNLADKKQLTEYAKAINQTQEPVTISCYKQRTVPLYGLFGPPVTYEKKVEKVVIPASRRAVANNYILGLLACTYCLTLIIYAIDPTIILWTWDPQNDPFKFSLLGIITLEWGARKIVEVTTGGVAYAMAHPLIFIMTAWLTGLPLKAHKR